MNSTALRAGAQSADNTHMVFADEEHEKFYYEKLEQARYQDCYHKALIYILGISEDTRNHFSQIYDIKSGYIKTECLHQGWQTSGSVKVVRLAFNLYTDGMPSVDDNESRDEQVSECRGYSVRNRHEIKCIISSLVLYSSMIRLARLFQYQFYSSYCHLLLTRSGIYLYLQRI